VMNVKTHRIKTSLKVRQQPIKLIKLTFNAGS
jgi:hypothetical protein